MITIEQLENWNLILGQNKFVPTWYWTKDVDTCSKRINDPHIKAEGIQEDRIEVTKQIINDFLNTPDWNEFTYLDMLNIQSTLLKENNYKGIRNGLRTHNVAFDGTPDWTKLSEMAPIMFPVNFKDEKSLLLWYTIIQKIHPLSDLNGRVFGIIVACLYIKNFIK